MDIRNLKSFIINLKSKPEQYNILNKQISDYGFTNIERWNATIGKNLVPVINKTTQLEVNEVPVTLQAYVDLNQGRSQGKASNCITANGVPAGGSCSNAIYNNVDSSSYYYLILQDDGNMCIYRGSGLNDNQ
jgi:hypothetical protein